MDLQGGLNVLVGPNNAGKTNLFDAIRHALGPTAARGEALSLGKEDACRRLRPGVDNQRGTPSASDYEDTGEPIRITLTFSDLDDADRNNFFEIVDFAPGVEISDAKAHIHLEATWSDQKNRHVYARWGGAYDGERTAIPSEILESLPFVYLPALRDSAAALTPGYRSVLARVLQYLAQRDTNAGHAARFEQIFSEANKKLEDDKLITKLENPLRASVEGMTGVEYRGALVRATAPNFHRILRTLRVVLDKGAVEDIGFSGMGYNNLLYMATILAYLEDPLPGESAILLIEEPEAHLSPQWTVLLGEHLAGLKQPQILVSSHSPTFAANVNPNQVLILQEQAEQAVCRAISGVGLLPPEERQLQRMLDVTRATLYFAKGLILVEGISEALLFPGLAESIGIDLAKNHITVLPICGVSFGVFEKLLGPDGLGIPTAIVTDADPPVDRQGGPNWETDIPKLGEKCSRTKRLEETFKESKTVLVCCSEVTLEYDLAKAGPENSAIMAEIWETSFEGHPENLNQDRVNSAADDDERALVVWRGMCRSGSSTRKAEFANLLAEWLRSKSEQLVSTADSGKEDQGESPDTPAHDERVLVVPPYIAKAIRFAAALSSAPSQDEEK